jgi:crotonobetainyl-CoA:carnitine CoA-transferase CaiB-like acyl-CoA transferase
VRVLELARILAGPWIGQTLADLGADVIKVESPEGDDTRGWGPPFVDAAGHGPATAAYFHSCNRGKRSIALDFRNEADLRTALSLAAHADVVIENFKVGGLARYGLDAKSLRAANPGLIYCSITGFGQDGPYAARAGYDFLIQGMAGAMSLTGDPAGQPTKAGFAMADIFTGLYGAIAILAALRGRALTGEGATVDLALMDTQIAAMANQPLNYLVGGAAPGRLGNAHPNIVPYEVFAVADGHVIIATGNDGQWRKLAAVLGAAGLADDPAFVTNKDRVANRARLIPELNRLTAAFAKADLLARLEAAGVPAGPINGLDEVFADPQVIARGVRRDLKATHLAKGSVPSVASPIVIDGVRQVSEHASPALDGDRADILSDPNWGGAA